jgi:hypothetical protein
VIPGLIEHLRATQNPDGGWGSVRGRASNTETTSFATLALNSRSADARTAADRGLQWLRQRQLPDGSWPLHAGSQTGSWMTALAVTCLAACGAAADHAARGAAWLVEHHRGRTLGFLPSMLYRVIPDRMPVKMNPELKGWSWTPNEFSWVEPTAYALIALKKLGHRSGAAPARIAEAERMLDDRTCADGGWNYGNSWVYGEAIPAYLETTAITLIALQDRRGDERNQRGQAALERMLREAMSGLALSWSILCLRIHGKDAAASLRRLADAHARTGFLGETKSIALALLAATDGADAFRFA